MESFQKNEFKNQGKSSSPLAIDAAARSGQHESGIHFPMEENFKQIKDKTVEAYDSSLQSLRQNPIKSIAIALGLGVAAGYFLKRK
jgi:ElaB/YqjD/DUF883 family membrane-anchored ribosome-binding protein